MTSRDLYERWLATANSCSSDLALFDFAADRSWTFRELLVEAERNILKAPVVFPRGNGAEFIVTLLRAWRNGVVTCPLESAQAMPLLEDLPRNCAHAKITSATSGVPKCVLFTVEQLVADVENIIATMGLRADWPNIASISLAHSYGFSNLVLPLVLHGIPLILTPAPLPEVILRASEKVPGVTIPAVPALWKAWHEAGALPKNLRLAISAGAPLPAQLEEAVFKATGRKIHNFYGSSECGGIAYDRSNTPRADPACAGTPMKNVRLSRSAEGTLVVESAAVGSSYWPDPSANLAHGRFQTTDLAEFREGSVYLLGRLTDILNIAGRKTSPETIEAALRDHPGVLECIVFGVPAADGGGDAIVAALHTRTEIPRTDLAAFLSQRLPAWQIPRHWWFTKELTVNQRGKISRADWRQRYLAH